MLSDAVRTGVQGIITQQLLSLVQDAHHILLTTHDAHDRNGYHFDRRPAIGSRGCPPKLQALVSPSNCPIREAEQTWPDPTHRTDWDDPSFLRLYLTTPAGTVIQIQVPVSTHHTWEMLEEYLLEHLPLSSFIDFGCELTLMQTSGSHTRGSMVEQSSLSQVHECFLMVENKKTSGARLRRLPEGN